MGRKRRPPKPDPKDLGNRPGVAGLLLDLRPCVTCGEFDELTEDGWCFECQMGELMSASEEEKTG